LRTRSQRRGAFNAAAEDNATRESLPALFAPIDGVSAQEFFNLDEADRRPAGEFLAQLPTRGLSGATGGTRCMGGATCGVGAT